MTSKASRTSNRFCRAEDLSNEASVESFFVLRLLKDLGYEDVEIRTKAAIDELPVGKGRKKEPYRPDFLLYCTKKPRWIIDAKAPGENPDDYVDQGAGYCLAVNMKYAENPCLYFMLTNGFLTRVYRWDQEQPVLSLRFADFAATSDKYKALRSLLGVDAVRSGWQGKAVARSAMHRMTRPTMAEVKRTFYRCHQIIWKAEKVSPQAAFLRFAKILFVKLWEDRRLRDNPEYLAAIGRGDPLPADAVRFSSHWIAQQRAHEDNPVDRILFRQLVEAIEAEIQARKRKRIFESDARLDVSPDTVNHVVAQLEHQYLFGIDEDLNGRMFEAFLTATMRGQGLGQYFTPRSIVKLMTQLGRPLATREKVERLLDGCCGTGGFLIEALTEMRRQVYENQSLTKAQRKQLLDEVANEAIFGIDAAQDPPLVKIARINMYLHGDGGSRVYVADGLRKSPSPTGTDSIEVRQEVSELRAVLEGDGPKRPLLFDVVLTNPPFSMSYSKAMPDEWAVLKEYELRTWDGKDRTSIRSAIMFLERYEGLLRPGGRLLTVIDDSILSGRTNAYVRDYIRARFIIRAVVSIHGDAFRRSGARVKTSVLYLERRESASDEQPAAFVYETKYIGVDDVVPRTPPSVAERARSDATAEIAEVAAAFNAYQRGESGPWLVPAERLSDRLDAKHLLPWKASQLEAEWRKVGATRQELEQLLEPIEQDVVLDPTKNYTFLRVSYAGHAERGESRRGDEVSYSTVGAARANDLVVSNISAVWGAICVLPKACEELLVTPEFTVLRLKPGVKADPYYLWAVLRSPAVIAEWRSSASGMVARQRIDWDRLRHQEIPVLDPDRQKEIGDLHRQVIELEAQARTRAASAATALGVLKLDSERARDRMERAKPPR